MPNIKNNNPANQRIYLVVRNERSHVLHLDTIDKIKTTALKGGEGNYILQPGGYHPVSQDQWYRASTEGNILCDATMMGNTDVEFF